MSMKVPPLLVENRQVPPPLMPVITMPSSASPLSTSVIWVEVVDTVLTIKSLTLIVVVLAPSTCPRSGTAVVSTGASLTWKTISSKVSVLLEKTELPPLVLAFALVCPEVPMVASQARKVIVVAVSPFSAPGV